MIKDFLPDAKEVREFREKIFLEDLNLPIEYMLNVNNTIIDEKFAYWYSDPKFLDNNFDRVLLYYHEGEAVGMAGGTLFNQKLYRGVQMYYILKRARKISGVNTLHFRPNGFFDWQVERAKELGCEAIFISVDLYDRRHQIMFDSMKNDIVGPGSMPNSQRKYTSKNIVYLDNFYYIKATPQKICYYDIYDKNINFNKLFCSR